MSEVPLHSSETLLLYRSIVRVLVALTAVTIVTVVDAAVPPI